MRLALLYLVALFTWLAPVPAWAQASTPGAASPISEVRRNYRIHFGGLYLNPSILLNELGVDSNVFNEAGQPKADFMFVVTPKTDLAVPIARRALIKSTAAVDGVYYRRFASERSLNPQITVRGEAYANHLTLFAEDAFLNTHQRANEELDLRVRRVENSFGGGAALKLTPKFSIEAAAHSTGTRFNDNAIFQGQRLRDTLNDDALLYRLTARQRLTPFTSLSLQYERRQDRFVRDPIRDTDSFRVMPGVEFNPRALISGSASVGYRDFRPKQGALPPARGLVAQLALSYTLRGSTMFGVSYDRDFQFSYNETTPYFAANSAGVSVRRAVGAHYDVIANATRHQYDYRLLKASTVAGKIPPVETTNVYGLNVGYRLRRQTRIGAGVSYSARGSSTDLSRGYTGFHFATTVSSGLTR